MLLAFELAYRTGRRWHADTHDAGREVFVAIKVSILGLLALLAFAFRNGGGPLRRSAAPGDGQSGLRVMLYGSLLPEPDRAQFRNSLHVSSWSPAGVL
jgi:hypothetical protein